MGLSLTSCQKKQENPPAASNSLFDFHVYSLSGPTMGTSYNIKLILPPSRSNELESLSQDVKATLADIEKKMSTYQRDSELSLFNASLQGSWFTVSDALFTVISAAQALSDRSFGAFDSTVGPLVNLWGFGPSHQLDKVPTETELAKAFARVGYKKLLLDRKASRIKKEGDIYLDLSAIAKGYGVDQVMELLLSKNITSALVEVGGEIRAIGLKPSGNAWRIAIESPLANTRAIQKVIDIKDMALATSGDYRNYFEKDGLRYSHTINPETGKPITHTLASVTVLHENCMMADGLATMFMVMGPDRALEYANKNNHSIFMLVKSEGGFTEIMSQSFIELFGIQ